MFEGFAGREASILEPFLTLIMRWATDLLALTRDANGVEVALSGIAVGRHLRPWRSFRVQGLPISIESDPRLGFLRRLIPFCRHGTKTELASDLPVWP